MTNRSKHMSFYCLLTGIILFSVGVNFIAFKRISYLEQCLCESNMWLSAFEFKQIENEIERLEKQTKSILKK